MQISLMIVMEMVLSQSEDCDDSNPDVGSNFSDCDEDGFPCDIDCDDFDPNIGDEGSSGANANCAGTDCLSILENGLFCGEMDITGYHLMKKNLASILQYDDIRRRLDIIWRFDGFIESFRWKSIRWIF